MSRVEDRLLRAYGQAAGRAVAQQVADMLRQRKDGLAGEDSGLSSLWSEICVQVRDEEGPYWEAYEIEMLQATESALLGLSVLDRVALFFSTEEGWDWLVEFEEREDQAKEAGEPQPSCAPDDVAIDPEELARHVVTEYLRPLAMNEEIKEVDDFFAARDGDDYGEPDDEPSESTELTEQCELHLEAPLDVTDSMKVPDKFPEGSVFVPTFGGDEFVRFPDGRWFKFSDDGATLSERPRMTIGPEGGICFRDTPPTAANVAP